MKTFAMLVLVLCYPLLVYPQFCAERLNKVLGLKDPPKGELLVNTRYAGTLLGGLIGYCIMKAYF